jgi:hypothetical protein
MQSNRNKQTQQPAKYNAEIHHTVCLSASRHHVGVSERTAVLVGPLGSPSRGSTRFSSLSRSVLSETSVWATAAAAPNPWAQLPLTNLSRAAILCVCVALDFSHLLGALKWFVSTVPSVYTTSGPVARALAWQHDDAPGMGSAGKALHTMCQLPPSQRMSMLQAAIEIPPSGRCFA